MVQGVGKLNQPFNLERVGAAYANCAACGFGQAGEPKALSIVVPHPKTYAQKTYNLSHDLETGR